MDDVLSSPLYGQCIYGNFFFSSGPDTFISSFHYPVACITLWVSYLIGLIIFTSPHSHIHLVQLYEYISLFSFEVRFIWAARWNLTKCLYLLTRYLQFLLVGAFIYQSTSSSSYPSFPKVPHGPSSRGLWSHITNTLCQIGKIHHRYPTLSLSQSNIMCDILITIQS